MFCRFICRDGDIIEMELPHAPREVYLPVYRPCFVHLPDGAPIPNLNPHRHFVAFDDVPVKGTVVYFEQ